MQTATTETTPATSRGRTLAYRILAGVLGLAVLVLSVPFAVIAFIDEAEAIHRMHNLSGAIGFGGLIGALLIVTAWRPMEQVAAFRVIAATSVGGVIAGAISGDLVDGGWLIPIVALAILIPLHPARGDLFAFRSPNLALVALSVLAAVPGIAFALTQAELQRSGVPSVDPHAEFHHYSGMAAAGITIWLVGLAASFATRGVRLARWWLGLSAIAMGVASLALSDELGAFDGVWAWAAIAGGVVYAAVGDLSARGREAT